MIERDLEAAFAARPPALPGPGFAARTSAGVHARWRRRTQKLRNAVAAGLCVATVCILLVRVGGRSQPTPHATTPPPPASHRVGTQMTPEARDLADEARAHRQKLRAEIALAKIELRRELEKEDPDEKRLNSIIDRMSGLEAQARKSDILAWLKMRARLGKEQRKQLELPREFESRSFEDPFADSEPMRRAAEEYQRAFEQLQREQPRRKEEILRLQREAERMVQGYGMGVGTGTSDGSLSVNAMPAARVFIDGQEIGMTPLHKVLLTPGRHLVRLVAGDQQHESVVDIRPGENTRLIKRFESK